MSIVYEQRLTNGFFAGLPREHVPAAVVVRPAAPVQAVPFQDDQRPSRRGSLEQDLDSGHVLSKREAGPVSRGDRQQPTDAVKHHRVRVVRHQVSVERRISDV